MFQSLRFWPIPIRRPWSSNSDHHQNACTALWACCRVTVPSIFPGGRLPHPQWPISSEVNRCVLWVTGITTRCFWGKQLCGWKRKILPSAVPIFVGFIIAVFGAKQATRSQSIIFHSFQHLRQSIACVAHGHSVHPIFRSAVWAAFHVDGQGIKMQLC